MLSPLGTQVHDGFSGSGTSGTGKHILTFYLKFLPSIYPEYSDPVLINCYWRIKVLYLLLSTMEW